MLANTPEMYEAHFGVPMSGAVLNALNTRLDADAIAFMLDHGEAKVLITDREFSPHDRGRARQARDGKPLVIDVLDPEYAGAGRRRSASSTTRRSSREGDPDYRLAAAGRRVGRDRAQLHLGHHRQSQGRRLPPPRRLPERARQHPRLEHAAARRVPVDAADVPLQRLVLPLDASRRTPAPTSACARSRRRRSSTLIREHRVTHYCGAPIVHSTLINAPDELRAGIDAQGERPWSPAPRRRRR